MTRKSVVDYIKALLKKGYDISAIRNVMLKYGYTNKDINEAVNQINQPTIRHEIHLSKATIFVIIFAVIALAGVSVYIYYPSKTPTRLLDLKLEPISTTAQPGSNIAFVRQISNLGPSKRFDVSMRQELLESSTFKVVSFSTDTVAVETSSSTQSKISVPSDVNPGDYILRVVASYDNKKAIATFPVKILSKGQEANATEENCFDGIKNQNEEDADCGGICGPCKILKCNDDDLCTDDRLENGKCVNSPIVPCCSNNVCEEGEKESCAKDCGEVEEPSINLDDIKKTAKYDPAKASQQCNTIEIPDLRDTCVGNIGEVQKNKNYCTKILSARIKDLCYSNIAKISNDNSICTEVLSDGVRDSCYMTFVLDNDDYSVCGKIVNKALRQSCESLRQLNEINQ